MVTFFPGKKDLYFLILIFQSKNQFHIIQVLADQGITRVPIWEPPEGSSAAVAITDKEQTEGGDKPKVRESPYLSLRLRCFKYYMCRKGICFTFYRIILHIFAHTDPKHHREVGYN